MEIDMEDGYKINLTGLGDIDRLPKVWGEVSVKEGRRISSLSVWIYDGAIY